MRAGAPQGPADRLLELLRERHGGAAYRCHPRDPGRWTALCPACGQGRLDIRERGVGGEVVLRCASGCDGARVVAALTRPEAAREELWTYIHRLLALAREQQELLRRVIRDDGQHGPRGLAA